MITQLLSYFRRNRKWSQITEWETFCDDSYYNYWAVRPKGETRWGHCFHVVSKEEAQGLKELLEEKSA